jgi:hypothetical protein
VPRAISRIIFRIVGQPPARDASRDQRLRWIRRFYWLNGPWFIFLALLFVLFGVDTIVWLILGVCALVWAQGLLSITLQIRREPTSSSRTL